MVIKCMGCMKNYDGNKHSKCPFCGYSIDNDKISSRYLAPGTKIASRYIVGKALGSGGFGITYVGWDELLQVRVAIKEFFPREYCERGNKNQVLSVNLNDGKEYYQKGLSGFIEEARKLASFNELESVVNIYNIVGENGTSYIIMEYLEGESLEEIIVKRKKMSCQEAINLLMPAINTLSVMHASGLIHRDIAPDNIFITKNKKIKLLDFGAARFSTNNIKRDITVIVKSGYSPQEQYSKDMEQGTYTDVYALAATMYRMITGELLKNSFERKEDINTQILKNADPNITIYQENALKNALRIDPKERTQTISKFIEEFTAVGIEVKIKKNNDNLEQKSIVKNGKIEVVKRQKNVENNIVGNNINDKMINVNKNGENNNTKYIDSENNNIQNNNKINVYKVVNDNAKNVLEPNVQNDMTNDKNMYKKIVPKRNNKNTDIILIILIMLLIIISISVYFKIL